MLCNILGPVFNTSLAQFLTQGFLFFCVFLWGGGAETPIFIVFSARMQNLKKHKKEKRTLFVSTLVLTNKNKKTTTIKQDAKQKQI